MHACTWKRSSPRVTGTAVGKEITGRLVRSIIPRRERRLLETKDGIKPFASGFVTHGGRLEEINELLAALSKSNEACFNRHHMGAAPMNDDWFRIVVRCI